MDSVTITRLRLSQQTLLLNQIVFGLSLFFFAIEICLFRSIIEIEIFKISNDDIRPKSARMRFFHPYSKPRVSKTDKLERQSHEVTLTRVRWILTRGFGITSPKN